MKVVGKGVAGIDGEGKGGERVGECEGEREEGEEDGLSEVVGDGEGEGRCVAEEGRREGAWLVQVLEGEGEGSRTGSGLGRTVSRREKDGDVVAVGI